MLTVGKWNRNGNSLQVPSCNNDIGVFHSPGAIITFSLSIIVGISKKELFHSKQFFAYLKDPRL